VLRIARWLLPVYEVVWKALVLRGDLQIDETHVRVLDPTRHFRPLTDQASVLIFCVACRRFAVHGQGARSFQRRGGAPDIDA
jgi:NADH-quinone oxidoreductase subunit A